MIKIVKVYNSEEGLVIEEKCIENNYKVLQQEIGCRRIDYVTNALEGIDMIIDDEFLYGENNLPSIFLSSQRYPILGTVIFARNDSEGNTISLKDEDISLINLNGRIILVNPNTNARHEVLVL